MSTPFQWCLFGDFDGVGVVGGVCAEAAPWPIFGTFNEAGFYWVTVHVAELFDSLGFGEDVEVVIARFPHILFGAGAGEALF